MSRRAAVVSPPSFNRIRKPVGETGGRESSCRAIHSRYTSNAREVARVRYACTFARARALPYAMEADKPGKPPL